MLNALLQALHEGAFAPHTRSTWRHHHLDDYYLAVRRDWVGARPDKAGTPPLSGGSGTGPPRTR
ncbi:hypothetical protein [Paludibacterium yongneupense]|uniref:hypothetical protein n=1 Tax=Paludibacterium yongneupense TaxID=400061 RepID=UPI0012EB64EE|nr:hypothetical protein [Paludibacterium yongneupense]